MWQPLNGIVTKVAPSEGTSVNDIWIPGGTEVCFSKHSMMHRKDIFGPDAEVFRPERWLINDSETLKVYERTWELSFSYGRFSCLGKGVALMELNKVFVAVSIVRSKISEMLEADMQQLLRRYDLALVNPVNTVNTKCHQLHVQKDMHVRVWQRSLS